MSMSTIIKGFRPPDEEWKRKVAVYRACKEADIDVPEEILKFFNWESPDRNGVLVDLMRHDSVSEWGDECSSGFEVDIRKLPQDLHILRFYNSW